MGDTDNQVQRGVSNKQDELHQSHHVRFQSSHCSQVLFIAQSPHAGGFGNIVMLHVWTQLNNHED